MHTLFHTWPSSRFSDLRSSNHHFSSFDALNAKTSFFLPILVQRCNLKEILFVFKFRFLSWIWFSSEFIRSLFLDSRLDLVLLTFQFPRTWFMFNSLSWLEISAKTRGVQKQTNKIQTLIVASIALGAIMLSWLCFWIHHRKRSDKSNKSNN